MEKIYNPKHIEESLYFFWEKNGFFKPNHLEKSTFCIMMPPPNITGSLHMGHAFQQTIMDILIRYHRMQGKNTFWQVGTDHAGIATQILVERQIFEKEQKTKKDYSRDDFIKKIWEWKKQSSNIITKQMRRLGISVDWDYEKFTLDPDISNSVREAFIILYKNNLIYQKKKLVHWDSKLETVISDLEVEHRLIKGKKWFIRYPIIENDMSLRSKVKYLIVSTTRPETLLGDTAIAVNPEDYKYNQFIGNHVSCPLTNRIIPIIKDRYADLEKGTGCVKITPAHDFNDYKVGLHHKLPMINIFTFDGRIKSTAEVYNYKGEKSNQYSTCIPMQFQHLDILSARIEIIKEITKLGFLEKIEECNVTVPYSERSGVIIEPMLTNQWYLKTSTLAKVALNAVKDKKIKFIPQQYESMYSSWMNNIEDWCISRQLWWGHRIPVWYDDQKNIYIGQNEKEIRQAYSISENVLLKQENDVLDTWFSSGLWTFSSLGWPKKTTFLKTFHPTNVLVSGFDIIFFWIARMIMLTMYFMKDKHNNPEVPFKNIYITGLIRDEFGKKMSKSKGNVIDPLDMIDGISLSELIKKRTNNLLQPNLSDKIIQRTIKQFPEGIKSTGTDALRFTFSALASSTRDIQWDMNRLKGYRNFCNKLWNASRFVLINTQDHNFSKFDVKRKMLLINKWILIEFNNTVKLYRESLDTYRFDIAANILYDFIWNIFCDWYLEFVKIVIKLGSSKEVYCTKNVLVYVLELLLKLAHPIMPFITETIWQRIKLIQNISEKTIMLQDFPEYNHKLFDKKILVQMNWMKKIIVFLRNIRTNMNVSSTKLLPLFLYNINSEQEKVIKENISLIKNISFLDKITILSEKYDKDLCIKEIIDGAEIIIPILKLVDTKVELKRLVKEQKKTELNIFKIKTKILNKDFLSYAPTKIVTQEKNKLLKLNEINLKLSEQIKIFRNMSYKK
ncbi:valine--tRNA ligase [Buchnera aphidicola str. APS (Acyrthosiphon pisum)]|uniref:Valine--tRNA ligase n=1 Tax=Buchnera aphidicola subsp. Acyrthosiphon pisum (strain APS) TaxID=107806 RepID=SYV_BUCAI|nr:valine--tRNA ligase [Buchnera aphidicola]P57447.1 RecName: Full=Valine--tRNA ligase; AltName: Full=Valyl-tRNA synthetase; Short=ValRS [Buchnera aphidicola str. APS (Acyrthosiphon pisum)]pir/F84972/ valine-tRNA ligase (EC 6.1.1.9) [imported] - Buchnera sp. (strain APS) [Buchnera sp. (in: enterobacteria)]ADP67857.1 valyl-tRNA synthetase [Buchnera aphidicola str. JF98 (Acyrthosiphon pisum)]ACL30168.1 valyl-tRNA synthetase [Buchnera aphidicola str. Tuc7 (Acyrthosiphon pisum)]ADP66185.1 valyl-tR